jgi:Bacterial Ig-like domain
MKPSKLVLTSSLLIVAGLAVWGVSISRADPQVTDGEFAQLGVAPAAPNLRTSAPGQAQGGRSKTKKAQAADPSAERDLKMLADLPAVVLSVEPKLGAADVDPAVREIRVTFSRPMADKSWSWVTFDANAFPKVEGQVHYEKDKRTCVMPVKLEPGKSYVMGINAERFRNFRDVDGQPALPYIVAFRTRSAR